MNYKELVSPENLFLAFDEFKRGKRNREEVMRFERNLEWNILELSHDLEAKTYRHGPYFTFKIWDPKFRVISKACVRDRIVHHALFKYLNGIFDKTFIFHSYSSRVGKGTHLGVNNLAKMMEKVSQNFTRHAYALKCDIRKFFASINHKILYNLIAKNVRDKEILWLIEAIISSFAGGGIPLGNLTSQIFANIYLHELDEYIKHELRIKFYTRYADDFAILHQDKKYLQDLIPLVDNFLTNKLKLQLHPNKIIIRKLSQGIDFLGYICFPHHRLIRTKTKHRMLKKLHERKDQLRNEEIDAEKFNQSLQSYLGMLKHANTFKLRQTISSPSSPAPPSPPQNVSS